MNAETSFVPPRASLPPFGDDGYSGDHGDDPTDNSVAANSHAHYRPYPPPAVAWHETGAVKWPGIGRHFFIPWVAAYGVFLAFIQIGSLPTAARWLVYLPPAIAAIPRLRNIGCRPVLALLVLIPYTSLPALVPCLVLPPGFAFTRKLDRPAWIITGALLLLLAVLTVLIALAIYQRDRT